MGLCCLSVEVGLVIPVETDLDFIILLLKPIKIIPFQENQFDNQSFMGIQSANYEHIFKTAAMSTCSTFAQFQSDLLSTIDAGVDLFISNIFAPAALKTVKIDLDNCFIPAHETFTSRQLPYICPLLNRQLLQSSEIENKVQKLKFIIEYCIYLGIKNIAFRFDPHQDKEIYGVIAECEAYFRNKRMTLFIIIEIGNGTQQKDESIWESFVQFRRNLKEQTNIANILEIGPNLPEKHMIKKWMGESIRLLSVNSDCFILNNKGYPVLSAAHEQAVKQIMKKHIGLVVNFKGNPTLQQKQPYFKYLGFVVQKMVQSLSKRDIQAQSLIDYLQTPLQPYIDNLDGEIYDIFEEDSVKYNEYQYALISALQTFVENKIIVCYYVGSGKGLILAKLMNASKKTGKKVKVYCIEKNPYPIQTLKRRIQRNKWSKFVEIVQSDIKSYAMPEHPDIIFSQLLGGFGDNELEPECIKWACKNATKDTRIVPQKYSPFIRPIACHNLHKQLQDRQRQSYYTVNLGMFYSPFKAEKIWTFHHPLAIEDQLNRQGQVEWQTKENMLIHGFEGTFDCNLFGNAYFSIVPETLNKDFYSWFPLYFSFSKQEYIQAGNWICIAVQRKSTAEKIWYQWKYVIKDNERQILRQSDWHNDKGTTAILLTE